MLTKAYISEVISSSHIRVRMPLFNKIEGVEGSTPTSELAMACICTLPNFVVDPKVGDIVIVGFEEDDLSKPVIIGYLSTTTSHKSMVDVTCTNLVSSGDTQLTYWTTIGEIKPENIYCLKNIKDNIKKTLDQHSVDISIMQGDVKDINRNIYNMSLSIGENIDDISANADAIGVNASAIINIESSVATIIESLSKLGNRIGDLETKCEALDKKFNEYLKKYPMVIDAKSYGKGGSELDGGQSGQVYFTLRGE